jgi:glycosyltransferase involved in cell wall biosynthesis
MNGSDHIYSTQDIAIIIPTKDRPDKIINALTSISDQTKKCGRLIVVDGGEPVKNIVIKFADVLPIEYYRCHPPGQIRQRNMAISLLDNRTPLVVLLDDDIVLEPGALKAMVDFWNRCEKNTAGISFNIVNNPPFKFSWVRSMFGMSSIRQGRVLRSGYNVTISPVEKSLKTQWLCGGATVWRQDILKQFIYKEINTKWAACEDLIFSYPIGKKYSFYVCADAKVRHEHIYDHRVKMKYRYYGRTLTLWQLYFVESHPEISRILFLWMVFSQFIARTILGFTSFNTKHIQLAIGLLEGIIIGLIIIVQNKKLLSVLKEEDADNKDAADIKLWDFIN